jgi:hypothetical protein
MEHIEARSHSWRVVDLLPPETLARLKRLRDRLADVELKRDLAARKVEREARKVA